ncbi:purine-cytosine permease family protein [Microbacterium testaceum]|uniref:purine-cytosine permease family protein n=1 Tax=Microbacterium testaceum TaxID=2033 RepID=UPI0025B1F0C0|nr:permease [Microbacterium testaceum]MDZ5144373.1 permease [Microbacterium testaceum]WJS89682.1 permease [Microbacterium testaceum]
MEVSLSYSSYLVRDTDRVPRWSLTMAWWALFSAMFWIYVAVASAGAVGLGNTLIGMALTVATYGVVNLVLSRYAARTGLTVELFSRSLFGILGSALATLIFAATAIYYAVFEGSIIAVALQKSFGGQINLWYLLVVVYAIPLAVGPVQRWLDRLNGILLPIYVVGLVAVVVAATVQHGAPTAIFDVAAAGPLPGWLTSYLIYMGVWIMMMYTFDYARLGRPADRKFHGTITFGWVFYLFTFAVNGLIGIYVIAATGHEGSETGVVDAFLGTLGFFGLLVIFVSQTRINTANYYLASTNLDAFATRVFRLALPRWVWVIVSGGIAYLLMLTNVVTWLLKALAWQGVFVTAWVTIALVAIALTRASGALPEVRRDRLSAITPGAIVWIVAAAVGIVLTEVNAGVLTSLAPLVTVAIAGVGAVLVFRAWPPRVIDEGGADAAESLELDEQHLR